MNKLIKNLSPQVELGIVLLIGFGLFIYSSTRTFFILNSGYSHSLIFKLTSLSHYSTVIYEILALSMIIYVLKIRGWTIENFNLEFTFRLIWIALLLMFIKNVFGAIGNKLFELLNIIDEKASKQVEIRIDSDWGSLALIILINSIYEELLLCGYLFKRLEKYHPAFIIGFSILIRLLYHTYQGWAMLISIVSLGLVFGYYYYKYKKLWPLIIAHGVSNLIAFLGMHFHWYEKLKNI